MLCGEFPKAHCWKFSLQARTEMSLYLVFFQGSLPGASIVGADSWQALHLPAGSIIWKGLEQERPWVTRSPNTLLPMKQHLDLDPTQNNLLYPPGPAHGAEDN